MRGCRIRSDYFLPPVQLTAVETMGLMLAARAGEADPGRPLVGAAAMAVSKLVASLPDDLSRACGDLMSHVEVDPGQTVDGLDEQAHFFALQRCIEQRRACDIVYQSPVDAEPLRCRLQPFKLHWASRAWYVFGRTDRHGREVRVFKLVRFESIEPTPESFRRPANFKVSDKLGLAWQHIPEGQEHDIEVEFLAKVATNVAEVRWHPTQTVRRLPNGNARVTFRVDGLNEISWWLCGYADQCRVIRPAELRARLAEMHHAAAERQRAEG
jgi:proteasome accessory factor B